MKYRIEMQPLAGRYVVALKDIQTGDLVKALTVNASAAEIIRHFCDGLDIDAIADSLHQQYGVPEAPVHADVEEPMTELG